MINIIYIYLFVFICFKNIFENSLLNFLIIYQLIYNYKFATRNCQKGKPGRAVLIVKKINNVSIHK
jgi:hypothetical protein